METPLRENFDPTDLLAGCCDAHRREALDTRSLEAALKPEEKVALGELREVMKDEPYIHRDTATLVRFLRARDLKVKDAEKMLRDMCAFRRQNIPEGGLPENIGDLPKDVQQELKKGRMFYLKNQFDKEGRQIFVCRSYLFEKGVDVATTQAALVFLTDSARKRKKHPWETVVTIWDATNFSYSTQYDSVFFKNFQSVLADNFPESLHVTIIYPIGWVFWGIYKVVQLFMAEETKKKLCFLSVGEEDKILNYIAQEDLLMELGGQVDIELGCIEEGKEQENIDCESPYGILLNTHKTRPKITLTQDAIDTAAAEKAAYLEKNADGGESWLGSTPSFLKWAGQT